MNPPSRKNIPRAIRQVLGSPLFYVFAILIIGILIPYTDPALLRNDVTGGWAKPLHPGLERAGLASRRR